MAGSISKILITRTDAIGDVMLTLPMVGLIKKYYPDVQIGFLGRTYTEPVITCCTQIDQFVNYDSWKTEEEALRQLHEINADTVIHVFPDKRIARLSSLAKIPLRIGTSRRWFHWLYANRRVYVKRKNSPLHEAQLNLQLLQGIGINETPALQQLHQWVSFRVDNQVPDKLKTRLSGTKKRILLHPKSAGSAREWSLQHYASLAELLPKEEYDIILCGTTKEKELIEQTAALFPEYVINSMGLLTLEEYIALIASSHALVAASTGPLHIAAACGIRAVGIYPVIKPMHAGRWQPIGEKAVYLSANKNHCDMCRHTPSQCACMNEVTPQQVLQKIKTYGK